MSLWEIYKAKRLGYADDLWTSLIGHQLGGYSWLSDYETTPYLYRAMPNLSHYYNREIMEEVVGGSVGWNQLVPNPTASQTINGVTFTVNADRSVTVNGTATAQIEFVFGRVDYISGHKYSVLGIPSGASGSTHWLRALRGAQYRDFVGALSYNDYWTTSIFVASGATVSNAVYRPNVTDLTLALGSTIADYVYSLEQATAGSGVAWLKEHFPKMFGQYNPYDAGSIQSVSGLVSHTTKDANDNVIGSYPLDSTLTLRGIPKLDNGKLYYDGDTYGADGSASRKYGVDIVDGVNVKVKAWGVTNDYGGFTCYANFDNLDYVHRNLSVCDKFTCPNQGISNAPIMSCGLGNGGAGTFSFILPATITSADEANAWFASNPTTVVYPLATPTTETAQPFTKTQLCDSGGTEEFVTSGIVSVGHKSKYAEK